ncbi:MAG: hypothetical protein L3J63_00100 [Geopsychrobacter sp.]|nr:hypothetical protein [Geopsychrobacter sp.]
MRRFIYLLLICLLSACALGGQQTDKSKSAFELSPALSHAQLREAFAALPGVLVPESEPLRVLFPAGVLFASGSVLPMPGGSGMLDSLVDLLKESNLDWRFILRAASGEGTEYDQGLAAARVKILKTYFKDVGLNVRTLRFQAVAEAGPLLEIQNLK